MAGYILITMAAGFLVYSCSSRKPAEEHAGESGDHAEHLHAAEAVNEGGPSGHLHDPAGAGDHSGHLHEEKAALQEGEVLVTARQVATVDISLGTITRQSLSQRVKSFGQIALSPSDEATISAVMGGIIRDIRVLEGDLVEKGEVIARIEHPDIIQLQQEYLEAVHRDTFLETEYKRQERLLRDSVNSAKTVQKIKADFLANRTRIEGLKKKLGLLHIDAPELAPENMRNSYPLRAPFRGYIARVNVNTGSHVAPREALFQMTANEKVHIDLDIYEKDLGKVAAGQPLVFSLPNSPGLPTLKGEVMKTGKRFDPGQRTARVHARILEWNPDLLPGMSVTAWIQTGGSPENTLPEDAVVADGGENYVFLLKKEGQMDSSHGHTGDKEEKIAENSGDSPEETHHHEPEAEHHHEQETGGPGHSGPDATAAAADAFFVFERVPVRKGITAGGFTAIHPEVPFGPDARFAVSNAQALMAEMKKGSAGHAGHNH